MKGLFCVALLGFSILGFSQIERPNRTIRLAPVKKPDAPPKPTSETVTPAVIKYESSLDKKDEKLLKDFSLLPKKEEKSILDTSDPTLRNVAEIYTQQQNDKLKEEGLSQEIVNADVFLGEFVVYTEEIKTKCRDYGAIDGDHVRIWVNDIIMVPKINLISGFQEFSLPLVEGVNIIKIQALNTGQFFPNTGQFIFNDGNGKLVTNQNWGLREGYNAIVRIVRRKGLEDSTTQK